jgi:outer membrane immunogenic protein
MDLKGTAPCLVVASCTTKSDWLATVSGRFGGVVADRALIYAKGGAAWMNSTHSVNLANLGPLGGGFLAGQQLTSTESTSWGWLVGLGAEYMITQNWTAFIEYNYIEFDKKSEANNINTAAFGGIVGPPPRHRCERRFQEQALDCQGRRELQVLTIWFSHSVPRTKPRITPGFFF